MQTRVVKESSIKNYFISTKLLNSGAPSLAVLTREKNETSAMYEIEDCDIETFDIFVA
jgi:hypothetical protein